MVTPAGTGQYLYNVPGAPGPREPIAGLVRDPEGNLYGITAYGGTYNWGTVFAISPTGTRKVLLNLDPSTEGEYSGWALLRGPGGQLYGTASRGGAFGWGT